MNLGCNPWHLVTETFKDSDLVVVVVAGVEWEVVELVVVMNPLDS